MVIKARIPPHHPRLYQFTILKHIEIHGSGVLSHHSIINYRSYCYKYNLSLYIHIYTISLYKVVPFAV